MISDNRGSTSAWTWLAVIVMPLVTLCLGGLTYWVRKIDDRQFEIITSAFSQLLGLVHDWQDRKHELAILDRQMEMQTLGHTQRLEEIDIAESQALYRHDAQPSGVKWVDGLRSRCGR